MNNIPWQVVPNLANIRQQEMRAEAASRRIWLELSRARREAKRVQRAAARSSREAKRVQRAAARSSRITAQRPATIEAATVTPLPAYHAAYAEGTEGVCQHAAVGFDLLVVADEAGEVRPGAGTRTTTIGARLRWRLRWPRLDRRPSGGQ
jgi:hypothetical protein